MLYNIIIIYFFLLCRDWDNNFILVLICLIFKKFLYKLLTDLNPVLVFFFVIIAILKVRHLICILLSMVSYKFVDTDTARMLLIYIFPPCSARQSRRLYLILI